jgi:hypothetical protein
MNNRLISAVIPGFVAVAALVLSFNSKYPVESLIGWAMAVTFVSLIILEYRIDWRRIWRS